MIELPGLLRLSQVERTRLNLNQARRELRAYRRLTRLIVAEVVLSGALTLGGVALVVVTVTLATTQFVGSTFALFSFALAAMVGARITSDLRDERFSKPEAFVERAELDYRAALRLEHERLTTGDQS